MAARFDYRESRGKTRVWRFWILVTLLVGLANSGARPGVGQDLESCDGSFLFDNTASFYLQINDFGSVIETILDYPLTRKIESLPDVSQALKRPEVIAGRLALGLWESQLGVDWLTLLKRSAGRGLFVGGKYEQQAVGIALHADDEELLKKAISSLLDVVQRQSPPGNAPFRVEAYRSGKLAIFDNSATVGRFGSWLLLSNQRDFLTSMADRLLDEKQETSLRDSSSFKAARQATFRGENAWLYVDLEPLRRLGTADQLFRGRTEEPIIEFLFGGLLESLRSAPWMGLSLACHADRLGMTWRVPYQAEQVPPEREYLLGVRGLGQAPALLGLPGTILQLSLYRDASGFWLNKENLFPENVIANLTQTDSQLSTVFGGVDFGSQILAALQPGLQVVIKEQEYTEGINPEIKIPSIALVARLQNPEQARRFRISFQSLVGLLNLAEGGMYRPQIDLLSTRENGIQMTSGTYTPEGGYEGSLMIFNFSPSIAFQDDFMIISTTAALAREIAEYTKSFGDAPTASNSNSVFTLDGRHLSAILAKNRATLVANDMLENGNDRRQAERRIDALLDLLPLIRQLTINLRTEVDQLNLELDCSFARE